MDACKECANLNPSDAPRNYRKSFESSRYGKHEEMRKAREDDGYAVRKDTVESKRKKSKHPLMSEGGTLNPEVTVSRSLVSPVVERNGLLSSSLNATTAPVEQNGTGLYKRGFVPRPTQDKQKQRKDNMAHIEHWVKVQKGDTKRWVIT